MQHKAENYFRLPSKFRKFKHQPIRSGAIVHENCPLERSLLSSSSYSKERDKEKELEGDVADLFENTLWRIEGLAISDTR